MDIILKFVLQLNKSLQKVGNQSGFRNGEIRMNIRVLSADDAHHYPVLRLKALKTNPEEFASL